MNVVEIVTDHGKSEVLSQHYQTVFIVWCITRFMIRKKMQFDTGIILGKLVFLCNLIMFEVVLKQNEIKSMTYIKFNLFWTNMRHS